MNATTEQVVTLTDAAASHVKEMLAKEGPGKGLRLFIEEGGCSGMSYGMVFDEKRDGDHALDFHGVAVLVDDVSANYMRGSVVDYVDALTGGGFKITNPNAKQSCGCGKSFSA
ncbi:MAG TPA: iron-sulfur cluster assembly accessory protein [Methylomirabilota bacterium]|nr:iron-sulfur cluster assembly accessory protein [Methylomirabilota bacterium]